MAFRAMCEADYKPGRGLLGEVHAPEEVLEAGVGAEGVDGKPSIKKCQDWVVFLGGPLEAADGLFVLAESKVN